jgi:hypothetical protein
MSMVQFIALALGFVIGLSVTTVLLDHFHG